MDLKNISLSPEIINEIVTLVLEQGLCERIVIFGSRANGNSQKSSDIDMAIFAKDWNSTKFNLLKNALEEKVKTPLKFDIVDFYRLNKDILKDQIIKEGKVIYDNQTN